MKINSDIALPVLTYAWVIALSLLSALTTYVNRLSSGQPLGSPYAIFFLDVLYCQMAGLITYFFGHLGRCRRFINSCLGIGRLSHGRTLDFCR